MVPTLSVSLAFPVFEVSKASVLLDVNGQEKMVTTHSETIGDILKEQEINVRKVDKVSPSLNTKIQDNMMIKYEKAQRIIVDDSAGQRETIWTTAKTVDEFLKEQNIAVQNTDQLTPKKNQNIVQGMEITIKRAIPINFVNHDMKTVVMTSADTVENFLKENNVSLGKLDHISPAATNPIVRGMTVTIDRGENNTDITTEEVAFKTIKQDDPSLASGKEKLLQEGYKGIVKNHFQVLKENGREVSRKLVKKEIISEPVDRIVLVGTKQVEPEPVITPAEPLIPELDKDSEAIVDQPKTAEPVQEPVEESMEEPVSAGTELYVTATAYTAYCEGCSGTTRTGIDLRANPYAKVIAVDPGVIPLGSKVWVEGYGYAIAGDTGGAIKGRRVDVFIPTEEKANEFGYRKNVKVIILE